MKEMFFALFSPKFLPIFNFKRAWINGRWYKRLCGEKVGTEIMTYSPFYLHRIIVIGDNAWICEGAAVSVNVSQGDSCIFGANSARFTRTLC